MAPLGAGRLTLPPLRHRLDLAAAAPDRPVQRVLVHATTSLASAAEVTERHRAFGTYDQRALLMADRADLVCTLGEADPDHVAYLEGLGIGPGAARVVGAQPAPAGPRVGLTEALLRDEDATARLARQAAAEVPMLLDPFIAGPAELELARRLAARIGREVSLLGDPAVAARVNRKDVQRAWAQELGVPVAAGEVVELEADRVGGRPASTEPLRLAVERRLRLGDHALVRGCDGASGSATRVVADARDAAALVAWAGGRGETAYLVDRFHEIGATPNILLFMEPERHRPALFVAATDQILDSSLSHKGNRFPSSALLLDEMVAHAEALATRLRQEGYAGWAGFDFCEYADPATGAPRLLFAELNARINGACYPVVAAAKLRREGHAVGAFVGGFVETAARSFAELGASLGTRLLRPGGGPGALVYNAGCLAHGYCSAVVVDATPEGTRRRWGELASGPVRGGQGTGTRRAGAG